jgi:hypothetical protein
MVTPSRVTRRVPRIEKLIPAVAKSVSSAVWGVESALFTMERYDGRFKKSSKTGLIPL